jgi:proline-specific peptidase
MAEPYTYIQEGFLPYLGYKTYYKIVGDLEKINKGKYPLVALHGRPPSHEVLEPLAKLAESGRAVIFYDQLGCGSSDQPDDPSLWHLSVFVDELDQVRRELNLERIHLLGHSWGGVIALEHILRQSGGIVSLILASTFVSRPLFDADFTRLQQALPADVRETLRKHEESGTT